MPLIMQESLLPPGEWGTWAITETEDALRRAVPLSPAERRQIDNIKGEGRRREFLAARLLLHTLSGRPLRTALVKDANGKPHLEDSPFHISISHTQGYSAAIAHPRPCGVDIQSWVPRIRRLARKFVSEEEAAQLPADPEQELLYLHYVWSAKEAMYKAYGLRQLDFRNHLFVDLPNAGGIAGRGELRMGTTAVDFDLTFRRGTERVLVGAVTRPPDGSGPARLRPGGSTRRGGQDKPA